MTTEILSYKEPFFSTGIAMLSLDNIFTRKASPRRSQIPCNNN